MAKQEKKQKRAEIPKQCAQTPEFKKSWKRYKRAGRRDMNEVRVVMVSLFWANNYPPSIETMRLPETGTGSENAILVVISC